MPLLDARPLLARLAAGPLARQAEDLTSEALALLLGRPTARGVLGRLAGILEIPWVHEAIRIQTQLSIVGSGRPDVTVVVGGSTVAFLEAKFEAGLTERQPVGYLAALPVGGACLFIVPGRRLISLWQELLRRAGPFDVLEETREKADPTARVAAVGQRWMGIVSWRFMTGLIGDAFRAAEDHAGLADLAQVEGVCVELEGRVAAPWDSEVLTGPVPRQLLSLREVIQESTDRVAAAGWASLEKLNWTSTSDPTWGRFVRLGGGVCYVHVNLSLWARAETTPLWVAVGDGIWSTSDAVREAIMAAGLVPHTVRVAAANYSCVPVPLDVQADPSQLVATTTALLQRVASLLRPLFGPEGSAVGG